MQEKLLKKVIGQISGSGSEKLVDLLYNKQNVNEFLIAKKLNLTINQTRNILYKLADEGLVVFMRKKDKKKGGWYTYFWTLRAKRGLSKYKEEIVKTLEDLEKQLKSRETERHYFCKNCDIEYAEEEAMLAEYTCAECGEVLEVKQPEEITASIKEEMKKLQNTLSIIDKEIEIIEKKEEKSNENKVKAEKRKKDSERRKRKEERDKEKAKLNKKLGLKKTAPQKQKKSAKKTSKGKKR